VGRKPQPRLVAPTQLLYAQVVKVRNPRGQVVEVDTRVVCGGPRRVLQPWRLRQLGTTLQTACMERWEGTRRGVGAPRRRRPRCLSWSRGRPRGRLWRMVSLSHFVLPHKSLRQGRTRRPPALAIGLTEHGWSYRAESWWPIHADPVLRQQMDEQIEDLLTPALPGYPEGSPPANLPRTKPRRGKAKPIPQAA
jgi:hypothetical protein